MIEGIRGKKPSGDKVRSQDWGVINSQVQKSVLIHYPSPLTSSPGGSPLPTYGYDKNKELCVDDRREGHPEPAAKDLCPRRTVSRLNQILRFTQNDMYWESLSVAVMPDMSHRASLFVLLNMDPRSQPTGMTKIRNPEGMTTGRLSAQAACSMISDAVRQLI